MNIQRKLTIAVLFFLSTQVQAVGLYDAVYENNQLLIPVLKAGEEVYEVTMVLDQGLFFLESQMRGDLLPTHLCSKILLTSQHRLIQFMMR